MAGLTLISLAFILISYINFAGAAKILIIPMNHHSHINFMAIAGQTLDKAGHNVTILTLDRHKATLEKMGVRALLHAPRARTLLEDEDALQQFVMGSSNLFQAFSNMSATSVKVCEEILTNDKLMRAVKDAQFDLAIMDGFPMFRCMYAIPYKFSVPFITVTALMDTWQARVPAMPSVEPYFGLSRSTNDMNIFERTVNFAIYIATALMLPPPPVPDYLIPKYCRERPQITFNEVYLQSEMWLLNHDNIGVDYPRTTAPHYQYIGGLGAEPSKPLPRDLETFVQDALNGVVVVSFGSLVKTLPLDIVSKFLNAFQQRQEKFIMRFDTSIINPDKLTIPHNVKLMKWLPQNDLLGHKKTVLFITHGGNNGLLETFYHVVPCLVMPLFGDQIYSAIKVKAKGYGDSLDMFSFTSDQLVAAVAELTGNKMYAKEIKRASEISRELFNAHESIVFWVNHILKYGGQHLKHPGFNMPLVQYLMLDVLIIYVLLFVILTAILINIIKCCFKCCRRSTTKKD